MPGHASLIDGWGADSTVEWAGVGGTTVVDRSPAIIEIDSSAGGGESTVAAPTQSGKLLIIHMTVDGGSVNMNFEAAINQSSHVLIAFEDVDDMAVLYSVSDGAGGYKWWELTHAGSTPGT